VREIAGIPCNVGQINCTFQLTGFCVKNTYCPINITGDKHIPVVNPTVKVDIRGRGFGIIVRGAAVVLAASEGSEKEHKEKQKLKP
jgi:hypothetical protein